MTSIQVTTALIYSQPGISVYASTSTSTSVTPDTRVTNYRHKILAPWDCVLNDGRIDTIWTEKSACDDGFYCNICATDLFCQRDAHTIGMSYVPESFRNTDTYTPAAVPKRSWYRGPGDSPSCPPCQKEYNLVIGTCYDDCNITAGIASCINGQVVKNAGKENLNYSMQGAGTCNLDCPSGYQDMGTHCAVRPENRGAGTPLECSGRWQQYGAQCYRPCNESAHYSDWNSTTNSLVKRVGYEHFNYDMQSAGLCSQRCPPGANDSGTFCYRQSYSRDVGRTKPLPED